jgi:metallophosphoesterase superfamily enzyme
MSPTGDVGSWRVVRVYCSVSRKKAMLELEKQDDDEFRLIMPALRAMVTTTDVKELVSIPEGTTDAELAFIAHAAVKRAVLMARAVRDGGCHFILPATETMMRLIGITGSMKDVVRIFLVMNTLMIFINQTQINSLNNNGKYYYTYV